MCAVNIPDRIIEQRHRSPDQRPQVDVAIVRWRTATKPTRRHFPLSERMGKWPSTL
ncbi:hypothetical protein AGR8A_pAt30003 [Agrobacterium fabrum str. J-07]|nr:hypothetical protein AGR8A_pAt30003 [Agrobacterium fabrum str. J-07]